MPEIPAVDAQELLTFDVALSFAGTDRDKARMLAEALRRRGLTVFFDEWFKAEIWGTNLITLLRDIYMNRARLCVPLISCSYATGPHPKHELQAMLERELLKSSSSLLPIRLDLTNMPGLSTAIAYVNYDQEGPEGLADLITRRLQSLAGDHLSPARSQVATERETRRVFVRTHAREPASESFVISDSDIVTLCADPRQYASPTARARLARELVIYLNWNRKARLGNPYGAWKEGNHLFLSTLPSLDAAQRTLEFEVAAASGALQLVSEWRSADHRFSNVDYWEWQPAVKGMTADRSVEDLDREIALLFLKNRGAPFRFPIVPEGNEPENLCGRLSEEPPEDYLDGVEIRGLSRME